MCSLEYMLALAYLGERGIEFEDDNIRLRKQGF
jgi:hypothetical protein